MGGLGFWVVAAIIAFLFLVFMTIAFLASRYKRCPSDKILVVYGRVGGDQSAECIHGGGTLVSGMCFEATQSSFPTWVTQMY